MQATMSKEVRKDSAGAIEILIADNEKGLAYAEQLKSAAKSIQANGFSFEMFEQIVEAIRFIETEMRRHCQNVEQFLNPLIDRHVKGYLQSGIDEHREIWKALSVLRECVKDIEDLRIHPAITRDLANYSTTIACLLVQQIEKENSTLLPIARKSLTPEECDQLKASISAARIPETLS